jgi:hypothetical protein
VGSGLPGLLASKKEGEKHNVKFYGVKQFIAYWVDADYEHKHNCTNYTAINLGLVSADDIAANGGSQQTIRCNGMAGLMEVSRPSQPWTRKHPRPRSPLSHKAAKGTNLLRASIPPHSLSRATARSSPRHIESPFASVSLCSRRNGSRTMRQVGDPG